MKTATIHPIEEAQVISEQTLSDGNSFFSFLAHQADNLSSGHRGKWMTEALILAGYANDKQQLRSAYQQAQPAVDDYFNAVNVDSIAGDAAGGITTEVTATLKERFKNNIPGFLAGVIAAAGGIVAYNKYHQD